MHRYLGASVLLLAVVTHGSREAPASFDSVRRIIDRQAFESLRPEHQRFLADLAERRVSGGLPPASFCWSDTPPEGLQNALDLLTELHPAYQFEDNDRWTVTATDGPGLQRGEPTTLTWGFLPDNVLIPGEGNTPSILVHILDNQFGSGPGGSDLTQRPWFTHFNQAMNRWGELIGVNYVYEPNDDEATFPWSPGVLGTRPDVRIGGHSVDGTAGSNIYAYNYFPNYSDMVIDTDNQATIGNSSGNYLLLRNLVAHEHGHGLGLNHSCPDDFSKVMEASIRTNFDGPQIDDVLGASRGYGDAFEFPIENDATGAATNLGSLGHYDTVNLTNLSIDGINDQDWFAFTLPNRMRLYVTLQPTGSITWDSSGDLSGCPYGPDVNSVLANNLGFSVYGPSGGSPITIQSGNPAGIAESLSNFLLLGGPGTYQIRVFAEAAIDAAQLYNLDILIHPGLAPVALCKNAKVCSDSPGPPRANNGSYDPDGDPITLTLSPAPPYPPGPNIVNLIVSDGVLQDTCQSILTVNRPPAALCASIQVEGDSTQGCTAYDVTPQDLDDGTTDPDGDAMVLSMEPPGPYTLGSHQVLFIARDNCFTADTCTTTVTVVCPGTLSAQDLPAGPFRLAGASPNPFHSRTQIAFVLEEAADVDLGVFDARGRRIATLVSGYLGNGDHRADWDGTNGSGDRAAAGLYFLRLEVQGVTDVKKVLLSP